MNSHVSRSFRERFAALPADVRQRADADYGLFQQDPFHPSLQFKQVTGTRFWSVRVGMEYRALALRQGTRVTWEWIGTHAEYDQILRRG